MADSPDRIPESILFADVGTLWTTALLIDQVAGQYRFVAHGEAPSMLEPPNANATGGLRSAIRGIERAAGRTLLDDGQNGAVISPEGPDGAGVDVFAATTSASAPLKIAAFSTTRMGADVIRIAARQLNSEFVGVYTADAPQGWSETGMTGAIEQVVSARPDIVLLLATPTERDGEALTEMLDGVKAINDIADVRERPPTVLVGTTDTIEASIEQLRESDVVDTLVIDGEASPADVQASISRSLTQFYQDNALARLPGFGALQSWSALPIVSTAQAQTRAVRLLGRQTKSRILFVHVGAETSHFAIAGEGYYRTEIHPGLGLGYTLGTVVESLGPEAVYAWMPGLTPERDLHGLLVHRSLYPRIRPATRDSLWLEQAVTRVVLRQLTRSVLADLPEQFRAGDGFPAFDYIIAGGLPFRTAPEPAQAVLVLLDALQPVGVTHVLRDRLGLLPVAGLLADSEPEIVGGLLSRGLLESLGTVMVPMGDAATGATILNFRMNMPDGGFYDVSVNAGDVYREYLPKDTTLELELAPARGIDVGLGGGKRVRATVSGGTAGLFIDARGRPLPRKEELVEQRRQVQDWVLYVGG